MEGWSVLFRRNRITNLKQLALDSVIQTELRNADLWPGPASRLDGVVTLSPTTARFHIAARHGWGKGQHGSIHIFILRRLRQEDAEFEDSLGYTVRF